MPADSIFIQKLANELDSELKSGRIDKITMSDKSTIMILIRANSQNKNLLITMASQPRCFLTNTRIQSTTTPLSFCLHLRKHIGGGMITNIEALHFERIIKFSITSHTELGELKERFMYIELMGKYSNIVITDSDNKITGTLKHISADAGRPILPGFTFCPPSADNPAPNDSDKIKASLSTFEEINEKTLMNATRGIAPLTAKEAIYRNKDCTTGLCEIIDSAVTPIVYYDNDMPKEYSFCHYQCLAYESKTFDTISLALDEYYSKKDNQSGKDDSKAKLTKATTIAIDKQKKKLGRFMQENQLALDGEKDKQLGELVVNNLHTYKNGDDSLTVYDWYNDTLKTIKLTEHPSTYAEKCFKKYQKKKRTCIQLAKQIAEVNDMIDYLESIISTLDRADDKQTLIDIENELFDAGIIKTQIKGKKTDTSKPRIFNVSGFNIYIGKSNIQNDQLVKSARGDDIWLHTQGIHGSHAVIVTNGKGVTSETLKKVAEYTAFFSKARFSENVPVDYTKIKNVKKPKGYPPGKVEYVNQKTLFVTPTPPTNE